MSFYQKYRPRQFSELLGQEQVVAILKSQAKSRAYHHAYLLFGASGTGKTTTARLLAMSLNCLNGHNDGEPCGDCDNCRTIYQGHNWDVIEVDGARFRGIEEIKELCYRANFSPVGEHKVYIIDEAHQITEAGFNAMLKLLEEPPPYLMVILCTTELARIPETIVSRCQLYPFMKIKPNDIREKLDIISKKEGVSPDEKHIEFIVQSSNGNLRTAENILEQVCLLR